MRLFLFAVVLLNCFWGFGQSDIISVGTLPERLLETSGLIFYNGNLITHNDSGNSSELYELDVETLEVIRTIQVANADNIDWEDLSQDSNYIYIGDFGNNNGDRQDLAILRISKQEFTSSDTVNAERILFQYEDQQDFIPMENSDFDAESLISINDNLIIFTKQWESLETVAYRIPNAPGTYSAERLGTYQVDGLVTGASFDPFTNTAYLIGHSRFLAPFFVELSDVSLSAIFGNTQEKIELNTNQAQMEAIAYANGTFYVTSEEFSNPPLVESPAQLFTFTLDENSGGEEPENPEATIDDDLMVFKEVSSSTLNYILSTEKPVFGMGIFDSSGRMVSYTPLERITESPIDISSLSQGLYYLSFLLDNDAISAPFFKQ